MEQRAAAAPAIHHRLRRRLAVDVDDRRDTCATGSNDRGFSIHAVEGDPAADIDLEELGRRLQDVGDLAFRASRFGQRYAASDGRAGRRGP